MQGSNETSPTWRKSSYSTEQDLGTCVEVADLGGQTGVRDSKNLGPLLSFSRRTWAAFILDIKTGAI